MQRPFLLLRCRPFIPPLSSQPSSRLSRPLYRSLSHSAPPITSKMAAATEMRFSKLFIATSHLRQFYSSVFQIKRLTNLFNREPCHLVSWSRSYLALTNAKAAGRQEAKPAKLTQWADNQLKQTASATCKKSSATPSTNLIACE